MGNGGGWRVHQGRNKPRNLKLTQSLHLKYTCGKHTVSNLSSLYTLFYSVINNSVSPIYTWLIYIHSYWLTCELPGSTDDSEVGESAGNSTRTLFPRIISFFYIVVFNWAWFLSTIFSFLHPLFV